MKRRDITYADYCRVALVWQRRGQMGHNLRAPAHERDNGYFALVDGVLYRYVG